MKDQVDNLQSCGIEAEFINSTLSPSEINDISQRCLAEDIKILYIAPERLSLPGFQIFLSKLNWRKSEGASFESKIPNTLIL